MDRPEKVGSMLARTIARDIAERGLPPGTALPPETEMLAQHNVSRASLREALRILEIQGLITMKTGLGGGPRVNRPTPSDFGRMATSHFQALGATMRDLIDARLALEPILAGLAAQEAKPDFVEQLEDTVRRVKAARLEGDTEYLEAASDFHRLLVRAPRNPILAMFGAALETVFSERVTGMIFPAEERAAVSHDHASIVRAIRNGDVQRAERLTRSHSLDIKRFAYERYAAILDQIVDWR